MSQTGNEQEPTRYWQILIPRYSLAGIRAPAAATPAAAPPVSAPPVVPAPLVQDNAAQDFETAVDGNGITISKYTGQGKSVVIPASINGKSVISIGGGAFHNCTSLTSVTIPYSVTSIGESAFSDWPRPEIR